MDPLWECGGQISSKPDPRAPLLWGFVHEVCSGPTAIYPENIPRTSKTIAWISYFHKESRLKKRLFVKVAKGVCSKGVLKQPQKNHKKHEAL